jgi:flagellar protein FliL
MAKAAPAPAAAAEGAAPEKGSKKKLIVIILIALLVLGGGGAAAFFMMADKGGEKEEAKVEEHVGPPTFVVMDQFVVNLADPDSGRYLQIGITYELSNPASAEEIKTFTPVIRSRILLVLSGKNVASLTSIEGKQHLMDELVDLARVTIKGDGKDPTRGIRDVHFSSFVIQ